MRLAVMFTFMMNSLLASASRVSHRRGSHQSAGRICPSECSAQSCADRLGGLGDKAADRSAP